MKNKPKISFIGCGFVGGVWIDYLKEKKKYVRGRDFFCYDPPKGMKDEINLANIVTICVPTPAKKDGKCDLSLVEESVNLVNDGKWIVIRSTVSPGTTMRLQKKYPDKNFIFMPEFLTEAQAVEDFRNADRLIIAPARREGYKALETLLALLPMAKALTAPCYLDAHSRFEVTPSEAELAKYFGNVLGAVKVTLAETFASTCKMLKNMLAHEGIETEIEYDNVLRMVAADYRIGRSHLEAHHGGYDGFGGYCFIKDTYAFLSVWREFHVFYRNKWAHNTLINLIEGKIKMFEGMLESNAAHLAISGITEKEAVRHSTELAELIKSRDVKTLDDYLPNV